MEGGNSTALISLLQAFTRGLAALTLALRRRRRTGRSESQCHAAELASLNTAPSLARAAPQPLTPFAPGRGERNTEKTNKQTKYEGNEGGRHDGNRDSLCGAASMLAAQRLSLHHT